MRLMRLAALLCCTLFVTSASSGAFAQDAEATESTEPADGAEVVEDADSADSADDAETDEDAEAAAPVEADSGEEAADAAADVEANAPAADDVFVVGRGVNADSIHYRFLSRLEYERFKEETGFDVGALMSCRDPETVGRRERAVTNRVPFELRIDDEGGLVVEYLGEENDTEGEDAEDEGDDSGGDDSEGDGDAEEEEPVTIQGCIDDALEEMELEEISEEYFASKYRYTYYDSTYYARRRMRHGEITGLYTLSGISAAVAVGSLIAARNDDAEREEMLATISEESYEYENISNRALRFRRAGWSMVGVSVASFVGATLLHRANRDIESRENPILVLSPGSPTGDLGFTLSSQF